jgi:hypothetical protein
MQKVYGMLFLQLILQNYPGWSQGFQFSLLKHSFWYLAGISVSLFICFLVLSVRCHTVWRQLLGLRDKLHLGHLRNKRVGDVESRVWEAFENLTWAQPCLIICRLEWAQPPAAEGGEGKMQHSCFS